MAMPLEVVQELVHLGKPSLVHRGPNNGGITEGVDGKDGIPASIA